MPEHSTATPELDARKRAPMPVFMDLTGGPASQSEKGLEYLTRAITEDDQVTAVTIAGNANGAIPSTANRHIAEMVSKGVPVFVLSTNYAHDTGPLVDPDHPYGVLVDSAKAGAVLLKDANINRLAEVQDAINVGFDEGYQGAALADYVVERFGIPEGLERYIAK